MNWIKSACRSCLEPYPITVISIDISSFVNKVSHCIITTSFSCQMERSQLMERRHNVKVEHEQSDFRKVSVQTDFIMLWRKWHLKCSRMEGFVGTTRRFRDWRLTNCISSCKWQILFFRRVSIVDWYRYNLWIGYMRMRLTESQTQQW